MRVINFKYSKLEAEFRKLNPRLQDILYWLAGWVSMNTTAGCYQITHIYRTQEEQDRIYAHIPVEAREKSVHQFWRGADISDKNFIRNGDNPAEIVEVINSKFPYSDGEHDTAIWHGYGENRHIHLQVKP